MASLTTVEEILDFAIGQERAAVDLYTRIAGKARSEAIRATFLEYAEEERGHERKLLAVKAGARSLDAKARVQDLRITDYAKNPVEIGDDPDYQTALLFAMHQEKLAFRLYTDLAARTDDAATKELLLGLAQEEAKHKLRFEIEYDENVLTEN